MKYKGNPQYLGDSNTGSHSLMTNHILCASTSSKPRTRRWTHSGNTKHWWRTRLARPSKHCEMIKEVNTLPRCLMHWQHPLASSDRGLHQPHLSKMELQRISTVHWRRGSLLCYTMHTSLSHSGMNEEEYQSLIDNNVWTVVDLPPGKKVMEI